MKNLLILFLVAIVLTLAGFHFWQPGGADKLKFRTLPVIRDKLNIDVSAAGMVEPVEIVDVGNRFLGRIKMFGPDPTSPPTPSITARGSRRGNCCRHRRCALQG